MAGRQQRGGREPASKLGGAREASACVCPPSWEQIAVPASGAAALTQELLCPSGDVSAVITVGGREAALLAAGEQAWGVGDCPMVRAAPPHPPRGPDNGVEAEKLPQENADLPPNTVTLQLRKK